MTIREYLKTLLQGVKTYIDEKIVKSDWNVNDENSTAYILNKPFGESLEDVILIEEQSIEGFTDWEEGNYGVTTSIQMDLVIGDSYTVIWDGTTYDNLICFDDEGCPTIGAVYKDYTNYKILNESDSTGYGDYLRRTYPGVLLIELSKMGGNPLGPYGDKNNIYEVFNENTKALTSIIKHLTRRR